MRRAQAWMHTLQQARLSYHSLSVGAMCLPGWVRASTSGFTERLSSVRSAESSILSLSAIILSLSKEPPLACSG